jgi:hydroxyacylglutathione hydrolase
VIHRSVADGIWVVTAGEYPSNSYICATGVPDKAVLIDAGLDAAAIDTALAALGMTPSHVFCTHGHFDHIGSAAHFQDRYGAPVILHTQDSAVARKNNFLLLAMKLTARVKQPRFELVEDGATFDIGGAALRYRHSPGHTPGSCMIELGDNLFTGDTLYARGVGLSKLPGEQPARLRDSILAVWPELDRFTIHPGHGASAAGAAVKTGNHKLRAFLELQNEQELLS